MGQFLLAAGTRGKRYALPHARIMMHQPSGGIGGTASDIAIQAEQMLYVKKTMAERIAFHTGQSIEQIETDSTETAGSPPTRRWTTASSTTWCAARSRCRPKAQCPDLRRPPAHPPHLHLVSSRGPR
jgi:hypothetical protein